MLRKISVIFVLGLMAISCDSSDRVKKPDNLIPKEKMSEILYDLYIINAAKGVNRKLLEKNGLVPETYILTKYNIDSTQFSDSNTYYAFKTEEYKVIVSDIKARLEKEKIEFEELQEKDGKQAKSRRESIKKHAKRRKDSIKKVIDSIGFN